MQQEGGRWTWAHINPYEPPLDSGLLLCLFHFSLHLNLLPLSALWSLHPQILQQDRQWKDSGLQWEGKDARPQDSLSVQEDGFLPPHPTPWGVGLRCIFSVFCRTFGLVLVVLCFKSGFGCWSGNLIPNCNLVFLGKCEKFEEIINELWGPCFCNLVPTYFLIRVYPAAAVQKGFEVRAEKEKEVVGFVLTFRIFSSKSNFLIIFIYVFYPFKWEHFRHNAFAQKNMYFRYV